MSDESLTTPVVAQKSPFMADIEAGKTYYWCACGKSAKQPFCDGAHKTTAFKPIAYTADETRTAAFCGCKASANPPMCDGSHRKLP